MRLPDSLPTRGTKCGSICIMINPIARAQRNIEDRKYAPASLAQTIPAPSVLRHSYLILSIQPILFLAIRLSSRKPSFTCSLLPSPSPSPLLITASCCLPSVSPISPRLSHHVHCFRSPSVVHHLLLCDPLYRPSVISD